LELFENDLVEVEDGDGVRYIMRRNPYRAEESKARRLAQIEAIKGLVEERNLYLRAHSRAKMDAAQRKVQEKIKRYKFDQLVACEISGDRLELRLDSDYLAKLEKFDGCYVIKTDVPKEEMDTQTAHARYKDLTKVEEAFRTFKTGLEEIRPILFAKRAGTRGMFCSDAGLYDHQISAGNF